MVAQTVAVHFVPVGSTDRSVSAVVDAAWCQTRLTEISAIFSPADVEFVLGVLDPIAFDDNLNLDVPPGADSNGTEVARQRHAEKSHRLAFLVRRYMKTGQGDHRYKAFNYSSVQADFVVAEPGSFHSLAHEFGHFFGLPHTFDDALVGQMAAATVTTVAQRVEDRLRPFGGRHLVRAGHTPYRIVPARW